MRIENRTRYETAPLRELVRRVARNELDPEKRRRVTVYFKETRGVSHDGALGRCGLGGNRVTIFLPKNSRRLRPNVVAHVLAHEFGHARGMTHSEMRGNPRYSWRVPLGLTTWDQAIENLEYLKGLTFTVRAPQSKQRPTDDAKLQNAAAHLKAWESRRRRAETGMKKWRQKVRYYETKIAAKVPNENLKEVR